MAESRANRSQFAAGTALALSGLSLVMWLHDAYRYDWTAIRANQESRAETDKSLAEMESNQEREMVLLQQAAARRDQARTDEAKEAAQREVDKLSRLIDSNDATQLRMKKSVVAPFTGWPLPFRPPLGFAIGYGLATVGVTVMVVSSRRKSANRA